jgi:tRNA pseudouridine55 synthase
VIPPADPVPDAAVIPLADAAAAAFPRVDLTAEDARRLAQGARLALPPGWQFPPDPRPGAEAAGPDHPDVPLAAFDPDGTLIALVTAEDGRLRSLAVFVDAAAKMWDT